MAKQEQDPPIKPTIRANWEEFRDAMPLDAGSFTLEALEIAFWFGAERATRVIGDIVNRVDTGALHPLQARTDMNRIFDELDAWMAASKRRGLQ